MTKGTTRAKTGNAAKAAKPKTTRSRPAAKDATDMVAAQPAATTTPVTPYVDALDVGQHDPEVRAKAEIQAFNDFFSILADRANAHGLEPTRIMKVGNDYMICFLKADGTYGNCRPYTNLV